MPNWCSNIAIINAPRPVIDEIRALVTDPDHDSQLLKWMRPIPPEEQDNWYDWCCTNWGTKWDITNPSVDDDSEEDSITISFDTAWAPPIAAFRHWAQEDGRVQYRLAYIETGMGFTGWDCYDGEYFDEDCANYSEAPQLYWHMAGEEFGIEPDEETEPLTEWYIQGAQQKGLIEK
jgi:hypothetical protein